MVKSSWLLLASILWAVPSWLCPTLAEARPRIHPTAVSTWDPRASGLSLESLNRSGEPGSLSSLSLAASFRSSKAHLSAQFGAHYLRHQREESSPEMRGVSLSAVTLFTGALGENRAGQHPTLRLGGYVGVLPSGVFALEESFVSVPFVFGTGVSWTPFTALTVTPWFELARSSEVDASIEEVSTERAVESAADGTLTRQEIEDLVEEGISVRRYSAWGGRAGLTLALHLGDRVDLQATPMWGHGQADALSLGLSLVVRWDEFVGHAPPAPSTPLLDPPQQAGPTRKAPSTVRPTPTRPPTRPARRRRFRQVSPKKSGS